MRLWLLLMLILLGSVRAATLSDEEHAQCALEGGCRIISKHRVVELLQEAYKRGVTAGQSACRIHYEL